MFITCAWLVLTSALIFGVLLPLLNWSLREISESTGCKNRGFVKEVLGQSSLRVVHQFSMSCTCNRIRKK
jgi:hypothetical protein